jgi:hypothetical protein
VVGDLGYVSLPIQRRIREEMGVAVITRLKADMHLVAPYTGLPPKKRTGTAQRNGC